MPLSSRTICCGVVLSAAGIWLSVSLQGLMAQEAAATDEPLSEIVAQGLGRKYPPARASLKMQAWPMPLNEARYPMMAAALSPDGATLATGSGHPSSPGELVAWDAKQGQPRFTHRFARGVRCVIYSPDGALLAAGLYDGSIRLYDSGSGRLIREFRKHVDGVNSVAFTPDGKQLVSGSLDDTIIVWDTDDGSVVRQLADHTGDVLSVAISRDGALLASAGKDLSVRVWDINSFTASHVLSGHQQVVETVAFSPDATRVASASWDGTVRVWNTRTGELIHSLEYPGGRATVVGYHPSGNALATGGFDRNVVIWDSKSGEKLQQFQAHDSTTFTVAYSADGKILATCGFDGVAKLWTDGGDLLQTVDRRPRAVLAENAIIDAAWSPDEEYVALAYRSGHIRITRVATGEIVKTLSRGGADVTCVAYAPDGSALLFGTSDGQLKSWQPGLDDETAEPTEIGSHDGAISDLSLSIDGKLIAACDEAGGIQVRELASGEVVMRAKTPEAATSIALERSGKWLATGHADGRVGIWDAKSGEEVEGGAEIGAPVGAVQFAPTDDLLAVMDDQSITLIRYTQESGALKIGSQRAIRVPSGRFTAMAFATRSPGLITGESSGAVRVWDPSAQVGTALPRRHVGEVAAIAVGAISESVLTAGSDGGFVWTPAADENVVRPIAAIRSHSQGARWVAVTPDDQWLISSGFDNQLLAWELASGEQVPQIRSETVGSFSVSPDNSEIAVGQWSKRIQLVNTSTGERVGMYPGLPHGPALVKYSSDQRRLLALFRDHGVQLFDLASFEAAPVVTIGPDELPFTYASFSPDGQQFVTCTGDYKQMQVPGKVRLHAARNGQIVREFVGHTSEVKVAEFNGNGARLATGGADKTVRLWDVATGKELAVLNHNTGVFTVTFVPNSELLMSTDYHGAIHVWDLRTGRRVQQVDGHADFIGSVSLSADLSVLATAGRDEYVRLWKLAGEGNELRVVDGLTK